jgi:hypothetical protein
MEDSECRVGAWLWIREDITVGRRKSRLAPEPAWALEEYIPIF